MISNKLYISMLNTKCLNWCKINDLDAIIENIS